MTNLYVRFQSLLGAEPVTRGEITIVHNDSTVTVLISSSDTIRVRGDGFIVGDFVYIKGDTITGKAPSLTITEVII